MDGGTVVVAMSGGVDSSVAATMLKSSGYDLIGITMRLHGGDGDEGGAARAGGCCSVDDVSDARRVCDSIGIPFYAVNYREAFRKKVMEYFQNEYVRGRTPNPCIACNLYMKYDLLLAQAMDLGADYLATGHYARSGYDKTRGRHVLKKALDETKDQSYVLYNLTQDQLAKTMFPLGDFHKTEIRSMAKEMNLRVHNKPDSQDICFVPDGDYGEYLRTRLDPGAVRPGDFVDTAGRVVGRHRGIPYYTVGQRKGLGLALGKPMFVVDIDADANRIVVGSEDDTFSRELYASGANWILFDELTRPARVQARIRYKSREGGATLYPESNGGVRVVFDEPQRAVTPGQAVVFYEGDLVVGGATIDSVGGPGAGAAPRDLEWKGSGRGL